MHMWVSPVHVYFGDLAGALGNPLLGDGAGTFTAGLARVNKGIHFLGP